MPNLLLNRNILRSLALFLVFLNLLMFFGFTQWRKVSLEANNLLAVVAGAVPSGEKPNIILIIADDLSWSLYSFMGHPLIKTPAIDKLAAEGIAFVNGTATAPICRPSLQSILTGLYQRDIKKDNIGNINREVNKVLPQYLAEAGYANLQTGKWWEADPVRSGFTEGITSPSSAAKDEIGRRTMKPIFNFITQNYLAPLQSVGEAKPFFVWYAPRIPHQPFDPPDEFLNLYPEDENKRRYYGMISWLDSTIDEITTFLDTTTLSDGRRLRDNTLIIYLADNGFGILNSKDHFTENGMRTPIILNFPGRIPAVGKHEALVSEIDILPTILEYAGLPAPQLPDALSLKQLAESGGNAPSRKYIFGNWRPSAGRSVRTKQYKFYDDSRGKPQRLTDLIKDPFEEKNLIGTDTAKRQYRALTTELENLIQGWWQNRTPPPLE